MTEFIRSIFQYRVYPAPGDPHGMIEMCTWMDPSLLDAPEITKKMIGNRPNTYTFTKVSRRFEF